MSSATAVHDGRPSGPAILGRAFARMHGCEPRIERGAAAADIRPGVLAEADRNYVKLLVGRETFHARSTLQQAEKTLQLQPMLRISRSCLVNINHVREVSRTPRGDFILVLAGGATVTGSEGFRDAVRQHLERLKVCSA
ncbi:MAG: LytTR family DNA-binding domain-containing protein [Steroidobacteraceae bacterium]